MFCRFIDWSRVATRFDRNSKNFIATIGFAVAISGIKTSGLVRCDQPRVLDLAERGGRKMDTLSAALMEEVLAKVATLFE